MKINRKALQQGRYRMKFRLFAAAMLATAAFALSGCTTSATTETSITPSLAPSVAPMPDLASAPVPGIKPDSATLAMTEPADLQDGEQAMPLTAAYAGPAVDGQTSVPSPVVASAPSAVPAEAVEIAMAKPVIEAPVKASMRDRECLMRAMYFESNRSSRDGQLAVGTVVMHRVAAGNWGKSVCGVVGAPKQFAPGVMSRRMQGDTTDLAALADAILSGKRHPGLPKTVMYFHQAGLKFRYSNIRYVLTAGGNTFYFKAARKRRA